MFLYINSCSTKTSGTLYMYLRIPGLPRYARKDDCSVTTIVNFVSVQKLFRLSLLYPQKQVTTCESLPDFLTKVSVADPEHECIQCCFVYIHVQQKLLELSNMPAKLSYTIKTYHFGMFELRRG